MQSWGCRGNAKDAKTIIDSRRFPDEVKIVNFTNMKIRKIREHFARDAKDTDTIETKSILGILCSSGSLRSSRRNVMWRTDGSIIRARDCEYTKISFYTPTFEI